MYNEQTSNTRYLIIIFFGDSISKIFKLHLYECSKRTIKTFFVCLSSSIYIRVSATEIVTISKSCTFEKYLEREREEFLTTAFGTRLKTQCLWYNTYYYHCSLMHTSYNDVRFPNRNVVDLP